MCGKKKEGERVRKKKRRTEEERGQLSSLRHDLSADTGPCDYQEKRQQRESREERDGGDRGGGEGRLTGARDWLQTTALTCQNVRMATVWPGIEFYSFFFLHLETKSCLW